MDSDNFISAKLYNYGKKNNLYYLIGRIALFLLIFTLLWLSITLADSVFYFSKITRWGLFIVNVSVIVWLIYRLLYNPFKDWYQLQRKSDLSKIALSIGKSDPQIKDRLVNLYQLSKQGSSPIVRAAVNQLNSELGDKSYSDKINIKDFLPGFKLIAPIFISAVFLLSFQGNEIYHSTLRLLNPANNYSKTPLFSFDVNPGNKDILYNQPLEITAKYEGPVPEGMNILLFYRDQESEPRKINMDVNKSHYSIRLKNLTTSFSYIISAVPQSLDIDEPLTSARYNVNVLIPPAIQELSVKIISPQYSKTAVFQNELNDGNITALKGSRVQIKISSNKILKKCHLLFANGDSLKITNKGRVASGEFVIHQNDSYKIFLEDTENLKNQNPISYTISLLPDNPPYVDVVEPGQDIDAQLEDIIKIKINAADDYGLSNVFLKYRYIKQYDTADSSWHKMDINDFVKGSIKAELYEYLDFSKFYVGYNDQLEYYAVAVDNNSIDGFATGKSPVYRIRFPSLNEMFEDFTNKENEKIEDLDKMSDESKNLKEKLEEINRELKRTEKVDWELKKQIESTVDRQKKIHEKVEKIQKEIKDMVDKLDQNSLMNPEILEKYNELQNLFKEIATPELMESMRKLQQAMERANPNEVQKALESFKLNQEAFQASLERTLELFKQVQLEQQMDQLVQQAQKLAEKQKEISKTLQDKKNLSDDEQKNIKNEQEQQKDLLESLQKNIDRLTAQQQLEKFPQAREKLQETNSDINEQNLKEKSEQLEQQLNQQAFSKSTQQSRDLQHSFEQVQQQLSSAQQNLLQQNKQYIQKNMLSATQKMLQLSYSQEKIQKATKNASQLNDDLRQMAREQSNVQNNLSKLLSDIIQLSKETFFLNPDLNKDLANASASMQKSLESLSERRNMQAASEQQKAMEYLNKSINSMQGSMQQMAGAQSGTGFEQFMEQLQKMAGAQGGLNGETLNFMEGQGNGGQMSLEQQAQRQRMAAQQKAIQQALKEMTDQMGNRSDVLGRLNKMGKDMDDIIQDMLSDNINRKTIDRQRQILSRMLDAQKSVREREYSKKRKAEQAKKYIAIDPKKITDPEDLTQKKIQDALKKALSEGYYSEYQKLINAYFKELSSSKNTSQ